jgi:hypothetical protein
VRHSARLYRIISGFTHHSFEYDWGTRRHFQVLGNPTFNPTTRYSISVGRVKRTWYVHIPSWRAPDSPTLVASVDVERIFSIGRLTIGDKQHSMSTSTFQAQISLGQWVDQPFMPPVMTLASGLGGRMNPNSDRAWAKKIIFYSFLAFSWYTNITSSFNVHYSTISI